MPKFKLCDICEFITDGTHQTPKYCESGGYIFLSSKDVTSHRIDWANAKRIPGSLHEKLYSRLAPRKNDVLLAKNGTTGVAAIVDRDEIFDVYVSLAVLRPKAEIFPEYLLYAINSPICKRQFDAGLKGVGVPNLHLNVIRETEISVPSYSQQIEICKKLRMVLNIIEQRNNQLKKMEDLIKARFVELFGDPITNPRNLEMKSLGELSCLITKGASPSWQGFSYTEDESQTLFVTSENVREGFIDLSNPKYIEDGFNEKQKRSILYYGDFLINIVGASIGRAAQFLYNCKANINQASALVRLNDNRIRDKYLLIYLNSEKAQKMYNSMKSDTGRANLSLQDIANLSILIPPISEQIEFERFVEQVDKSKVAVQAALDETKMLFDSLMQEYFG